MKPYESYKKTNIPWLEAVPSHWEVERIGALFTERREKVSDKDFAPLSVTKKGIVPQLENAAKSNDGDNRKLVCDGDFVINSRSDRKGSSGISDLDGSVSLINIVLRPRESNNKAFMHNLLRCNDFIEEYYKNGRGIVADLWTTRFSEMKTIMLPIPPRTEQDQIVRYLDWHIFKINKLSQTKKRQIELLKEQQQALINNVVTNSDFIPVKLKRVAKAFGRIGFRGYNAADLVEQGQGAITISPSNILENNMSFEKCSYLNWEKYYESPEIMIENDDILIVKTGSSYGKVGYVQELVEKATINPQLLVLKNIMCNSKLLSILLKSIKTQNQIHCEVIGSTIPTISESKIMNLFIDLPPFEEQQAIVDYITDITGKIDTVIKETEQEIELLSEYKTSLISSVVTGKVDVRDVVVPKFEAVEDLEEVENDEVTMEGDIDDSNYRVEMGKS